MFAIWAGNIMDYLLNKQLAKKLYKKSREPDWFRRGVAKAQLQTHTLTHTHIHTHTHTHKHTYIHNNNNNCIYNAHL